MQLILTHFGLLHPQSVRSALANPLPTDRTMSNQNRILTVAIVLSASVFVAFRSASALVRPDSPRVASEDPAAATASKWVIQADVDSASDVVVIRQRVPRSMMTYRFRVEVTSATVDSASMEVPRWEAALRLGSDDGRVIHQFTNASREWSLISHYGIRLETDTQVILTVRLEKAEERRVMVRLAVDHDPKGRPELRRAIQPVLATAGTLATNQNAIYEWTSEVDGMLVGISDLWRPNCAELRLIDITADTTIWGDGARGRASFDASSSGGVQSLFVPQVAGHLYRLIVSPKTDARVPAGQPAATMMVQATRSGNN